MIPLLLGIYVCVVASVWADTDGGPVLFSDSGLVGLGMIEPLALRVTDGTEGRLTLSVPQGAERVAVFEQGAGVTNEVALPKTWRIGGGPFAAHLLVRGVRISSETPGDTVLQAVLDDGRAVRSAELALTVTSNAFTVFVDQPGTGGDRRPIMVNQKNAATDIGHTVWQFTCSHPSMLPEDLRPYANQPMGFVRRPGRITPFNVFAGVPARFVMPDTVGAAKADVEYTWAVSPRQFADGLRYCAALHKDPGLYNVNTRNCTDAAIEAGAAAGVAVPDTQGTWLGGGGSNPGDLGEDLRKLNASRPDGQNAL
jgi:hypothetical protein